VQILKEDGIMNDEKFVYLTTKGRKSGADHVVELWFALAGGKIYLSHEGKHTDWMKNLLKNNTVKMKIGSTTLTGGAKIAPVGSPEREVGMKALYVKYYGPATKQVLDDWFELSSVFEISLKQ
jgi:deazaflavin-dependent oxidoreductase (nitroreductase family)